MTKFITTASHMEEIIEFLKKLSANNNREWFNAHKDEYLHCKSLFDSFTLELIEGIRHFDDSIGPLTVSDCTYRIYRDTRFSADKTPYKTHFGAFIVPDGKKSGYGGYYFHVGVESTYYQSTCFLAAGDYCCMPSTLKIMREDIVLDEGKELESVLKTAKGFVLDNEQTLKRVPSGFPSDKPYSNWLKLKNYCLLKNVDTEYILAPDLLNRVLKDFKATMPFLKLLNRTIKFAKEEAIDRK